MKTGYYALANVRVAYSRPQDSRAHEMRKCHCHCPPFSRLPIHIFVCLSLMCHPYYLKAWNRLMFNPYNELMCAFTSFPSLDNKRDNGQNISRKVKKEKEIGKLEYHKSSINPPPPPGGGGGGLFYLNPEWGRGAGLI